MDKRINPELIDEESPEWTVADTARAVRIDGLPESLQRKLRESGSWQTRVATALID